MENYYLNYDEKRGEIKGFYLKSIHGDNIPTPFIEISPEKHRFFMENNSKYKININTLTEEKIEVTYIEKEPTEQERLLSTVLLENAEIKEQLKEQQELSSNLMLQIAQLKGGNANV